MAKKILAISNPTLDDNFEIPPLSPSSFKSKVNKIDTENSNETLPIPSLNDTSIIPAPTLDDTSIVVQPTKRGKRGRREYNNLDQTSIITTTSQLRSSKKKKT